MQPTSAGVASRRSTVAWILYDMANTIFSFNIVSTFYSLWLKNDVGLGEDTGGFVFNVGNSLAMGLMLILSPMLGAVSDRARRRIPFLIGSTLACVLLTMPLGFVAWPISLLLFILANVGFQSGLIFYDALLPTVSTPQNRGRVGAVGVAVGYLGSLVGLGLGQAILAGHEDRDAWVFLATGAFFLVIALPAFLWVREHARRSDRLRAPEALQAAASSFASLWRLLRGSEHPRVRRFLIGRVLYTEAANTIIINMTLYITAAEVGFTDAGARLVLLFGILGAVALSPLFGVLVDRIGPKHTLDLVVGSWAFLLLVVILVPSIHLPKEVFYPLAFALGGALGGLWSADRPLMVRLAPPDRLGEFYGFYAMVGRFSAVVGPLLWAFVAFKPFGLGLGQPAAVIGLLLFMFAAILVLRRLPDPDRPGPTPLAPYLPWRGAEGHRLPLPPRWWTRFPAHAVYLVVTAAIYLIVYQVYGSLGRIDPIYFDAFAYRIPRLFTDPRTVLHLLTAQWINVYAVQLIYVWVLLLLFGIPFEIREGWKRVVLVFYASSIVGGICAGLVLHPLHALWPDVSWIDRAWNAVWAGGSAGAFGLMGAYAGRARRPWLLLLVFSLWELNAAIWFLKSFTPAFHLGALATGFALARYRLPPRSPSVTQAEPF